MNRERQIKVILLVVAGFLMYYLLFLQFKTIKTTLDSFTRQGLISYIITYLLIGIPVFAATSLINRQVNVFRSLGLYKGLFRGLLIGLICTLPMFTGGFMLFDWQEKPDVQQLIASTLIAGLAEELFFRGFLFGQIYRNTQIGFIPAIVFGALIFASGHLYQGKDAAELAGIFGVTFAGAVFFAWLFVEWQFNLWVPVFTHTFMNLSWYLFAAHSNALGGASGNIFRVATIVLAIALTVILKRRKGQKMAVNRNTLWQRKEYTVEQYQ